MKLKITKKCVISVFFLGDKSNNQQLLKTLSTVRSHHILKAMVILLLSHTYIYFLNR